MRWLLAEVQKRAAPVILDADDLILRSATGSGKTMSFLLPAMARLDYPPDLLPEDLEVSAALSCRTQSFFCTRQRTVYLGYRQHADACWNIGCCLHSM